MAWAPFFSGAERALLLTLRALDATRYSPYVLVGTDGEFAAHVRSMGIPCEVIGLRQLERRHPVRGIRSVAAVVAAARRYGVSLIHANEMASFQPGGYAGQWLRIPAVTHVRFPDEAAGYRWFFRPGFSLALFVSRALRDQAMAEAPDVFETRSDVLHDGVEMQPVWTDDDRRQRRRELGLPDDDTVVIALTGQVAEIKGIWDFVEAARMLSTAGEQAMFVVLGDDLRNRGQTRRAMEERVAALGLASRFKFLGFRADTPQLVQAFDVIAVPSHLEPLGNSTLEAMAAGRPVVGSRVGGIPEMLIDQETGLLIEPANPRSLACALAQVLRDPRLRARMSVAARARARDAFGLAAHGAQLQGHYDRCLAATGASA